MNIHSVPPFRDLIVCHLQRRCPPGVANLRETALEERYRGFPPDAFHTHDGGALFVSACFPETGVAEWRGVDNVPPFMEIAKKVDSLAAVQALGTQLKFHDRITRMRGESYYARNKVLFVEKVDDSTVRSEVEGTRIYRVELKLEPGLKWSSVCTCPIVRNCKHAVATALEWQSQVLAALDEQNRPRSVESAAVEPSRPPFLTEWEPVTQQLGRRLTPDEANFLEKLSATYHKAKSHHGGVSPNDIRQLGFATHESRQSGSVYAYEGWWDEFPDNPLGLWQYIAGDIERSGLKVPVFLRAVTDTGAVHQHLADLERQATIERWTERFTELEQNEYEASAAPELDQAPSLLEVRFVVGNLGTNIETRAGSDLGWKPAPRTFLERFTTQPNELSSSANPATMALALLVQEFNRPNAQHRTFEQGVSFVEMLHRLVSRPLTRSLVVGADREPLRISPGSLRWRLDTPADGSTDYTLRLITPDNEVLPPTALHLPGRPSLYVNEGVVYRGPAPLDGKSSAGALIPAEVIENSEVLQTLWRLRTELPASVKERILPVPVNVVATCRLYVEEERQEMLFLELTAESPSMFRKQRWGPDGWEQLKSQKTIRKKSNNRQVEVVEMASANSTATKLEVLKLNFDLGLNAWTRRVRPGFPEEFVAWRASLPKDVVVHATGELASLLENPIRATIDFELIENPAHRDWFDLALALRPEDATLTKAEISLLLRARGRFVRLEGKGWRRLEVELDADRIAALEAAGVDTSNLVEDAAAGERQRLHAVQLTAESARALVSEKQAIALRQRLSEFAKIEAPSAPAGLLATLRDYQREGFHFLAYLSSNRLGGVLADDMGLGKTVQTIAWLLWLVERAPLGARIEVLVVCPKSVVGNWEAECARFAPSLEVVRFAPVDADVHVQAVSSRPRITVANYTQLRLRADAFARVKWTAVVLDEGQFIKNPASKVAQVARELQADHRIVLTGTPIENRLLDLWSLFAFAMPGLLNTQAAFKRRYGANDAPALASLRRHVRHFLLRRTKLQVAAELPPRTEEEIIVELEPEQMQLYQAELKLARAQLLQVNAPKQLDKVRFNILASLLKLRQICCHPALVDPAHANLPSAKLDALLERLEELQDEGQQVLVFSQFVEMLRIIQKRLNEAKIGHLLLTGQTENRDALVQQFQSDRTRTVFLLSLKAAGFGLNLTAASYVILYDPWWNPAVEAQAIDRTHRIGQVSPVNAYRLIARGTVEEKIRLLQKEKSALSSAVVQEETLATVMDLDTIRRVLAD